MKTLAFVSLFKLAGMVIIGAELPVHPDTTAPKQIHSRPIRATLPGYSLDPNAVGLTPTDSAVYRIVPAWLRARAKGKPVYVIDGQVARADQLKDLKASAVQSVIVTDGKKATALYGKVAREGVVAITTKAALQPRSN